MAVDTFSLMFAPQNIVGGILTIILIFDNYTILYYLYIICIPWDIRQSLLTEMYVCRNFIRTRSTIFAK